MTGGPANPVEITGRTRIMFILADPVAHGRASAMLNRHFAQCGIDLAASPLHVVSEDLAGVVAAIQHMRNLAGFGVTIPTRLPVARCLMNSPRGPSASERSISFAATATDRWPETIWTASGSSMA
jgi:Shikimate dehydrogenase substrate binding domain